MSLTTILASVKVWLATAEQWVEALFSKLVREEQALIPVVEQFIEKAQTFLASPEITTIAGLIPDGIGTEIEAIANEVLAFILAEITTIAPTLVVASVSNGGIPVYANPDAVAKTAFQQISQLTPDGQKGVLSSYSTRLLQAFAPSGANVSFEEAQLAHVINAAATKTAA
jgi:hypothetical protein